MNNYNLVIIQNKQRIPFLNLTEKEFYNELWKWCYEDDLWDYLYETPEVLNNKEELEDYLLNTFIPECLFHEYEDDNLDCFAFIVSDEKLDVREYNEDRTLSFVLNKIKEHYN